jgi:putative SOS response-associated peptidase YedK
MPVILQKLQYSTWLDPRNTKTEMLKSFLMQYLPEDLTLHEVDTHINNPKNEIQVKK